MKKLKLKYLDSTEFSKIYKDNTGTYYSIRDQEPYFCLVAHNQPEVVEKTFRAMNSHKQMENNV